MALLIRGSKVGIMSLSSQQFVERYAHMSDDQLSYEYGLISQLTHEAAQALNAEVLKRGLDTSSIVMADAETPYVGGETVALKKAASIYKKIVYWNAVAAIVLMSIFFVAQMFGFDL